MTWKMVCIGILLLTSMPLWGQENSAAEIKSSWANGVQILFTDRGESVIHEIQIQVDGIPAGELWQRSIEKLFRHIDFDGNGTLESQEAVRLPSGFELRQSLWGNFFPPSGVGERWSAVDRNQDGKLNLGEVESYYRTQGVGVTVGLGRSPNTSVLNQALRRRLDVNQDGIITLTELAGLVQSISAADLNNDELVAAEELAPGMVYPGTAGTTRVQIGSSMDQKGPPMQPVAVLLLEAPSRGESRSAQPSTSNSKVNQLMPSSHVVWRAVWEGTQVNTTSLSTDHLLKTDSNKLPSSSLQVLAWCTTGKLDRQFERYADQLRGKFGEADLKREGILSVDNPALAKDSTLSQLLLTADRDADGRLQARELEAWISVVKEIIQAQVLVTLVDYETGLYEFLDADRDGLLSLRELRSALQRLRDGKVLTEQELAWDRLPRNWSILVSRGHPQQLTKFSERTVPTWFRGMDRNNDGDVSRREFLAEKATFEQLDKDHDGLISVLESNAAILSSPVMGNK